MQLNTDTFNIVLLGPPGCGKGTQSELIEKKYGFNHISTGHLFRCEMDKETPAGLKAKALIEDGKLCPDDLTLDMLNDYLLSLQNSKGFVLDGVPRTIAQADMLEGINYDKPVRIDLIIYLKIEEEESIRRILLRGQTSGRSDDNYETVKKRLQEYYVLTKPLAGYYYGKNRFAAINGMLSIFDVFQAVCKAIDFHYKK